MNFGSDIHVSLQLNCNNFDEPFPLAPILDHKVVVFLPKEDLLFKMSIESIVCGYSLH